MMLSRHILSDLISHQEQLRIVGAKARALRDQRRLSRGALAEASGVSVPTIARFENHGTATLSVMLKIAVALDALSSFESLFAVSSFDSLEEFERAGR